MKIRGLTKVENAVRKARIAELADWYAKFRPSVKTLRVYSELAGLLCQHRAAAESLGFEMIELCDTFGRSTKRYSVRYRGFQLMPEG